MKTIIQQLKIIVLALIIGLGAAYVMAWTGPTAEPPGDNVPAPINEGPGDGTGAQYKANAFGVGGLFQTYTDTYLAVESGNVGIGTSDPQSKLDVAGSISSNDGIKVNNMQGFTIVGGGFEASWSDGFNWLWDCGAWGAAQCDKEYFMCDAFISSVTGEPRYIISDTTRENGTKINRYLCFYPSLEPDFKTNFTGDSGASY